MKETEFVFTRYLYEKEEVKIALLFSLLNKNDDALFWAYELYYSGFKEDLTDFIWTIYYQFYAAINPSFETFLYKKCKELEEPKTIAVICNNFMIRSYTADVFILNQIVHSNTVTNEKLEDEKLEDEKLEDEKLEDLLKSKDYVKIAHFLKELAEDKIKSCFTSVLNYFTCVPKKINATLFMKPSTSNTGNTDKRIILLSRIMHGYSLMNDLRMGKNLYVAVKPEEIVMYETIETSESLPAHKILKQARIYNINETKKLNLFSLKRETQNIQDAYFKDWLYYASHSPLWKKRIEPYGKIVAEQKKIIFFTEEKEEEFDSLYNYYPDEQSKEVSDKSVCEISPMDLKTWNQYCLDVEEECVRDYLFKMRHFRLSFLL